MPQFYIIIARKIFFPKYRGGGLVPLLPPVSYAYMVRQNVKMTLLLSAVCVVSWLNKTNVHSFGAEQYNGVTTARDCLDYCARTKICVGVDIDYNYWPVRCWVYDNPAKLHYTRLTRNFTQHQVLSRQCHTPTTTGAISAALTLELTGILLCHTV